MVWGYLSLPLATSGVSLCCHGWTWCDRLSKRVRTKESEEIFWILIIQKEEKNTHWVLTDANVSRIVWFEWLWVKNTYACDSIFLIFLKMRAHGIGCGGRSAQWSSNRHEQLHTTCISLHQAFIPACTCLFTSATEFLGRCCKVKYRYFMRLITEPAALSAQRVLAPRWERWEAWLQSN